MQIDDVLTLVERSMDSLVASTRGAFGNDREQDARRVQVKNIQYVPLVDQGMIQIRANTHSDTDTKDYQSVITLDKLNYISEEEYNELQQQAGSNAVTFTDSSGNNFFAVAEGGNSDAKVRCTCEDFRWRFAPHNYSDNSLQGEPPEAYVKKTDRPSVNPSNSPGVCKHLIKLKNEIEREDFFRSLLS